MSGFLVDTLLWTGALLTLVLLIRRPVAALFGPKAAYALWALPMVRLLLPPLVLPASMAPATEPMAEAALAAADRLALNEHRIAMASHSRSIAAAQTESAPSLLDALAAFDWTSILLPIWLAGAAVFLVRRYALYFAMRALLLEAAWPVGEAGKVRLVETPATDIPVAFGVLDKVVALPPGFMADRDRAARDLALAHELAHHRGHDLVCNMLVQPLFALHWFTPLAALGWRALRRDQEAACDARVIACQPRGSRAAYAAVIARYATQPRDRTRLALAAPMACPVLGDRSIVQRLKSLAMTDISARRQRAGRLLIGAGALALPLTGSISYAQDAAAGPSVPPAAPMPPAAAAAPLPPAAPEPPEAPRVTVKEDGKRRIVRIERIIENGAHAEDGHKRVERRVYRKNGRPMTEQERAEFEADMGRLRQELGEHGKLRRELERELGEHSEFQKEMRETFGETGEFQRGLRVAIAEAQAGARAGAEAAARAPKVTMKCRLGQREVAETVVVADGKQRIFVCNALATAGAIALARAEIASTRELTEKQRAQALRSLDHAEREVRAD